MSWALNRPVSAGPLPILQWQMQWMPKMTQNKACLCLLHILAEHDQEPDIAAVKHIEAACHTETLVAHMSGSFSHPQLLLRGRKPSVMANSDDSQQLQVPD